MGNIIVLAKNLHRVYFVAKTILSDDYVYFRGLTKLEQKFYEYLKQQVGFSELEVVLKERQKKIDTWENDVRESCKTLWDFNVGINFQTCKIDGKHYVLDSNLSNRIATMIEPLKVSEERLQQICNFDKQYSSSVVGSNWKFKKIFPTFKATTKTNPKYVLPPEIVDELINNYFLAIKFGFTLDEIS